MTWHLLPDLQAALRAGEWQVACAVRDGQEAAALWPGFHERVAGVAIDVGSTTLAAHLCDPASRELLASAGAMSPQIRFGEDLMSRVSCSMLNAGGAAEMTTAVRKALAGLIQELCAQSGAGRDTILEVTLVGNPIMHHLSLKPVRAGPKRTGSSSFNLRRRFAARAQILLAAFACVQLIELGLKTLA